MEKMIDITEIRDDVLRGEKKEKLLRLLEDLFWNNPEAYDALVSFCNSSSYKMNPGIKRFLIQQGILARNGSLPSITNELVYEMTTGLKPYWLN